MALLLLAAEALPGQIEAATVDHGLRRESADEARMVAAVCHAMDVPHAILPVAVSAGNLQSEARTARYAALAGWVHGSGLGALATAHHADDQAETLLMRLNRASGVAGLAGVRARGVVPGTNMPLVRPLLDWRKQELAAIVSAAGIEAAQDPSNEAERFDRVRVRKALAAASRPSSSVRGGVATLRPATFHGCSSSTTVAPCRGRWCARASRSGVSLPLPAPWLSSTVTLGLRARWLTRRASPCGVSTRCFRGLSPWRLGVRG